MYNNISEIHFARYLKIKQQMKKQFKLGNETQGTFYLFDVCEDESLLEMISLNQIQIHLSPLQPSNALPRID